MSTFLCLALAAVLVQPPTAAGLPVEAKVARVVDGDTIKLDNGETVRLLAIDTPETVHPSKPVERFGKEASSATRKALLGEVIELTYDQNSAATRHRDKYGRLLAYVRRKRDGLDVNASLVRFGYAHAYTEYPTERGASYVKLEREARDKKRGLWADEIAVDAAPPNTANKVPEQERASSAAPATVYITKTGTKYHRAGCSHLTKSSREVPVASVESSHEPCEHCFGS